MLPSVEDTKAIMLFLFYGVAFCGVAILLFVLYHFYVIIVSSEREPKPTTKRWRKP